MSGSPLSFERSLRSRTRLWSVAILVTILVAILCVLGALVLGCSRTPLSMEPVVEDSGVLPPPACNPATGSCGGEVDAGPCSADFDSDPENCGTCGNVCFPGNSCVGGACVGCVGDGCSIEGQVCCPTAPKVAGSPVSPYACVDLLKSATNCGGCSYACGADEICSDGECVGQFCKITCPTGMTCCTGGCVNLTNDLLNCGACAHECLFGGSCLDSHCPATCNDTLNECQPNESCCPGGCADVLTDPNNCGTCSVPCGVGEVCAAGTCVSSCGSDGGTCASGQSCCGTGCTSTLTDPANCGGCNIQCGATAQCVAGACEDGQTAFNPTVNPTYLTPGVHTYSTIHVPAGVTVYVAGGGTLSGTLDLHATGAIEIDGTIDVSGGRGAQSTLSPTTLGSGSAGGGGFTGEPYATAALSASCPVVAGNAGQLGMAVSGSVGTCGVGSTTACTATSAPAAALFAAPAAAFGGGGGVFTGYRAYGAGGGGAAGGAPGFPGAAPGGELDCTGVAGGGGAVSGGGGVGGGAPYDGRAGSSGQFAGVPGESTCSSNPIGVGGGGGGSIGTAASSDLAVATTFQTGSGGGGGSADYTSPGVFGGTSGGGGAGGSLRLQTSATIVITGQLLANGGVGADALYGVSCNPGAAGGGGSGGVVVLSAPSIQVSSSASISAAGGAGGAKSSIASGGAGGAGGLGRIRLSVAPSTCALAGTFAPPLSASGCAPAGAPGVVYVGTYPN